MLKLIKRQVNIIKDETQNILNNYHNNASNIAKCDVIETLNNKVDLIDLLAITNTQLHDNDTYNEEFKELQEYIYKTRQLINKSIYELIYKEE